MGSDVEQWRPLVEIHFGERTDGALRVMECESGGNPGAYNASSGASGLFQFLGSTWRRVGGEGDVFDPAENIRRAAVLSKGGTDWHEWTCKP
jgi:soluble lytic murein transglycosylase-like protein